MQPIFLAGDSHYAAVAGALAKRFAEGLPSKTDYAHVFVFNGWKYGLSYPFSIAHEGRWILNPEVKDQISFLSDGAKRINFVSMFGGGHHHALTLIAHKEPFDCVIPERPDLPLNENAQLLTISYIESVLMNYLPGPFREIQNFINAFPGLKCIHIESPPSIGDDHFVRQNLGKWFADKLAPGEELKLTHRTVRQKIWLIHSRLYDAQARKAGFEFLRAPQAAMDESGYLRPQYYGDDATHANAAYGELILRQLEENLGVRVASWSTFG